MKIFNAVNELINYGIQNELISIDDYIYIFNRIINILSIDKYNGKFQVKKTSRKIVEILDDILDYAIKNNIINDTVTEKDLFDTEIMDILTPRPHEVIAKFWNFYKQSPKKATDYFYNLSINCNYIRYNRLQKNLGWVGTSKYGDMLITINLSKPEKDPKEIALLRNKEKDFKVKYPKCVLCKENVGYGGTLFHPSRANLRYIPLNLNNEKFYFQYSPYTYYNEHCIILKEDHIPMQIDDNTYKRLLDFVDMFPEYFIGSNADLPIVGGSILTHEHYQAGCFTFPIDKAGAKYNVKHGDVCIEYLNWPLTVLRLTSKNREEIYNLACKITHSWSNYQNKNINIFSTTSVIHNTVTPIVRKINDLYIVNIVLRNNYVDEKHPYGLYHPDESLHHIKKENIGLIEVMGLAILPGRLKEELNILLQILNEELDESNLDKIPLHKKWYYSLKGKKYTFADLQKEVTKKFTHVLECCNVFKFGTQEYVIDFIEELL